MSTASVRQAAREEKFVECYLAERSCDASKAYRAAFGCSAATAKPMARAYLKRPRVRILIEQGQKDRALRMADSADKVLLQLQRDHDGAAAAGQYGAAIRATELRGKQLGMFGDKLQIEERVVLVE